MATRIDTYPTHELGGFRYRRGRPLPFGATPSAEGINFSIYSSSATGCTLVLFRKGQPHPMVEVPFPKDFRIGDVYSIIVFDLDIEDMEYGYRFEGPWDPRSGHRFDPSKILADPCAKALAGRDVWRGEPRWSDSYLHRSCVVLDDFDWQGDRPLEIPICDLVIYEMHVRAFTASPTSRVSQRGSFAGIREKIPYLKELGVNCVELLPVFEFDEWENARTHPDTGETLLNFWGYSTLGFFAPKAGYAATGAFGMQVDEFKSLVQEFHANGIEVILDVVYNHTAEGNQQGPHISFRGIDNRTYYMLTPDGEYYNFSGCGNTFNCNHPVVRQMVVDSLRYWASDYHIDGFRFDLASILGRDVNGVPLPNPPLLEALAYDPVLSKCKLIAEAWDAGGLYQVGSFPAYGRWAEWNGKYRDCIRKFVKGDVGQVPEMIERVQGSPDVYPYRGAASSINFVTCHDGFTLRDLVSYNNKHNELNGHGNTDGADDNNSWNCGVEGEASDPEILAIRLRQMKNFLAILLLSRGIPMILMGDEIGRTQGGNNNGYCHDSELSWMDWGLLSSNSDLFRFVTLMIAFRQQYKVLRGPEPLFHSDMIGSGRPDISFHGPQPWTSDLSGSTRCFSFLLCGEHAARYGGNGSDVYVLLNMYWDALPFQLLAPISGSKWHIAVNTSMSSPQDVFALAETPVLEDQRHVLLGPRSVIVLVSRKDAASAAH
jgi:isoamylase